jgi:hypothetical protein
MLQSTLVITNPDQDHEQLADFRALYAGGKKFRERIKRFLLPNEMEPAATYELRCREASYRSYVGPIVDYFAAFLLSSGFVPRAKDDTGAVVEADEAYARFDANCDGNGGDLDGFLRGRATDALVSRRAWWRLEKPSDGGKPAADRAEFDARRLGDVVVRDLDPLEVLDWSFDEAGELEWVTTYTCTRAKRDPRAPQTKTRHEWRIYDTMTVDVYAVELAPNERCPDDVPLDTSAPHGFTRVPIVCFDVDEAFWVLNRLSQPQLEHFRLSAGLGWAIRRTCYAMPVFSLEAGEDGEYKPPSMGAGYYLIIGANDKMTWAAPPTEVFEIVREEISSQKDEVYRMVHQMALGVENNAASVGRSGESKLADAEAIRVILTSLGSLLRCAIEKTYALVSDARGDTHAWGVEGLDVYDDIDAAPLIQAIESATAIDIPSETFQREVKTRAALALVASAEQATKDTIREEIAAGVKAQIAEEKKAKAQLAQQTSPSPAEKKDAEPPKPSTQDMTSLAAVGV